MSCHIVIIRNGHKVMLPVSSREEYIKVRGSEENQRQTATARLGFAEAKRFLVQMNYSCLPNDDGTLKGTERLSKTFGMDIDFDPKAPDFAQRMKELPTMAMAKKEETGMLMLERSAGKGFHGVFIRNCNLTQEENLRRVSSIMGVAFDEGAKDHTRVFYTTTDSPDDLIYLDDRLFDNGAPSMLPPKGSDEAIRTDSPKEALPLQREAGKGASIQTSYRGTPLIEIANRWLMATGGIPTEGDRNHRLFRLAVRMRYITNFKSEIIAANIPHCGLPDNEIAALCASACSEKWSAIIPKDFESILDSLDDGDDEEEEEEDSPKKNMGKKTSPTLPPLPPIIKEMTALAPDDFKPATIIAQLPILGTLAGTIRAEYRDGTMHAPAFQVAVEAPQASGKSFARHLVDFLMKNLKAESRMYQAQEQKWRDECRLKKNDKQQPKEPDTIIRYLPGKISIAALLKRLDHSHGHFCFSFCDEVDTLRKSWKAGEWSNFSDIMRLAFDGGEYGQDYMSDQSYSTMVYVHYNTLHCGTPKAMRQFYTNSEDGSVSRVIFIELPDQFGKSMPVWKKINKRDTMKVEAELERISKYSLNEENGLVELHQMKMAWLNKAMKKWTQNQQEQAVKDDNRALDTFCRRSAVVGFRAGMLAWYLWGENDTTTCRNDVCKFARWVADYMVEQLVSRFNVTNESNTTHFFKAFNMLAKVFTKDELTKAIKKAGYSSQAKDVLYLWKQNKKIVNHPETPKQFMKI